MAELERLPCHDNCPYQDSTRNGLRPCALGMSTDAAICYETLYKILSRMENSGHSVISAQIIIFGGGRTFLLTSSQWPGEMINGYWDGVCYLWDGNIKYFT